MSDVHSLAYEYAAGSLTEADGQAFESHLPTCPDCREEVADMREIAVQLSEAVATDPPPGLRASVLGQISHTSQDAALRRAQPTSSTSSIGRHLRLGNPSPGAAVSDTLTTGDDAGAATSGATANVVPLQRRSVTQWASGLLAVAAVLAAIVMGGWALSNRNDARDATAQTEQLTQLTQLLSAADVTAASSHFGSNGNGTVVASASQSRALLVTSNLPELPNGKVYEAWTIKISTVPAGTFMPTGSHAVVSLPSAAVDAAQVAVTVEPAGGSEQPTTRAVFTVDVT